MYIISPIVASDEFKTQLTEANNSNQTYPFGELFEITFYRKQKPTSEVVAKHLVDCVCGEKGSTHLRIWIQPDWSGKPVYVGHIESTGKFTNEVFTPRVSEGWKKHRAITRLIRDPFDSEYLRKIRNTAYDRIVNRIAQ